MTKQALFLVAAGLWACGGAGEAPAGEEDSTVSSTAPAPSSGDVAPGEGDVAPVARYRFVDTTDGMTVEATSDDQVTTFSCPTRTCGGMCDECAARACSAAGELSEACQFLVTSCNDTCRCESPGGNCGFPVCAADRMICYVDDTSTLDLGPNGPTDPSPFGPAARPSESGSNLSRPNL
jgi:hypothetical protein